MLKSAKIALATAVVAMAALAGCGDSDNLSRAEAEQIVEAAIAGAPEAQAGISDAAVRELIESALAGLDSSDTGMSRSEVEQIVEAAIAGVDGAQPEPIGDETAAAPSKDDAAAYTQFVVATAIDRYEFEGLDAALAYYNDPKNVDGQWYVFVVDQNDDVVGHFEPGRLGLDLKGWVGTDVNGYVFGPEMLSADEDGKWVSYVYRNPASGDISTDPAGDFLLKHAWVVRHDGFLFGSGWYISTEDFTPSLVSEAVQRFQESGLAATVAYFNDPQTTSAGLRRTLDYYNNTDTVDGRWLAFIADPDGTIIAHNDPETLGTNIADLLDPAVLEVSDNGAWITGPDGGPESMRIWAVNFEGNTFGAGWYSSN